MKILRLILALCLAFAPLAQADGLTLKIGKAAVQAEVAATPEAREQGLMHREHLCTDCGMLFVFPVAGRYGFWMKNTPLPLAIAFISRDGRIINIAEMQPDTVDVHYAEGNAQYALEMNGGWFAAHGVKPGDGVKGIPRKVPPMGEGSN